MTIYSDLLAFDDRYTSGTLTSDEQFLCDHDICIDWEHATQRGKHAAVGTGGNRGRTVTQAVMEHRGYDVDKEHPSHTRCGEPLCFAPWHIEMKP